MVIETKRVLPAHVPYATSKRIITFVSTSPPVSFHSTLNILLISINTFCFHNFSSSQEIYILPKPLPSPTPLLFLPTSILSAILSSKVPPFQPLYFFKVYIGSNNKHNYSFRNIKCGIN
jgi:hypothetical protein